MMKSLVEEALARDSETPVRMEPRAPAPSPVSVDNTDAELMELLQKLKTNIKIIGCGGGGSNTISRISEENIAGAETYAANTDAQHLLAVEGAAQDPAGPEEHPRTGGGRASPRWERPRPRRPSQS